MTRALYFQRPCLSILKIDSLVVERLLAFAQDDDKKLEAGGVLMGRILKGSSNIVIDENTEPMSGDAQSRFAFERSACEHQDTLDARWSESVGTCGYLVPVREWQRLGIAGETRAKFEVGEAADDVFLDVSRGRVRKWALVRKRIVRRESWWRGPDPRLQEELEKLSAVLDGLLASALAVTNPDVGQSARISAEQLLRAIVVQRMTGWGNDDLAFYLQDSALLRRFCRLGPGVAFSTAMLEEAIHRVTPQTMALVTGHLVAHGF